MRTVLRLAVLGAVIGATWWASGLGRRPVDPRSMFTAEQIARADSYQHPKYVASVVSIALGIALLAFLGFAPAGRRLLAPLRGLPWPLAAAASVAAVLILRGLLRLPLSFWRGHVHEKAWGFSTQSAAGWFGDWGKSIAISLLVTAVVWIGLVALMRWLPRTWPVPGAVGAAVVTVLLSFMAPVLLEPIFNRFTPLEDARLAAELRSLAERAGVPVREILVADASRRTAKENAYVSGFGRTRRLVVYDTLLRGDEREVAMVVAHELGHRRSRHVELGTLVSAGSAALLVLLVWLLMRSGRLPAGARGPGDPALFPIVLLAVTLVSLAMRPPGNWLSRRWEEHADRFALELTGDREGYVRTERGLALRNLADLAPGPVAYRFFFTHPAPAERIALAGAPGHMRMN